MGCVWLMRYRHPGRPHAPGYLKVEPDRASAVHRDLQQLAGEPLTSREVAVNLIGATTTLTGLSVHAELDEGRYPTGEKVSDREMR